MPFFDYYCRTNGRVVEVHHAMGVRLKTWGEVCRAAGVDPGRTPAAAPVVRLVSDVQPRVFRLRGLDKDDYGKKLLV